MRRPNADMPRTASIASGGTWARSISVSVKPGQTQAV